MRKVKANTSTDMTKMVVMKEKGLSLKIDFTQNMKPGLAPYSVHILLLLGFMYLECTNTAVAK